MLLARVLQRIGDLQAVVREAAASDAREFGVEKLNVELCVMDDDVGVFYELQQVVDDFAEFRLAFEKLAVNPVHRERTFVTVALRIHVLVKPPLGNPTAHDLKRTDLDNAVAVSDFEPRCLGIKHHLSHDVILTAATQPAAKRE